MKKLIVMSLLVVNVFAVCDPIKDPASCVGPQGIPGKDGANAEAYAFLEAGMAAVSGVELNPSHKGFSFGFSASSTELGKHGGALGLMWGFDLKESKGFNSAINIKAYKSTGGDSGGVTGGITLEF